MVSPSTRGATTTRPHARPPTTLKDTTAMLTELLRNALARLTTPLETATYSCSRCGLRVKITDDPERVTQVLTLVINHPCKPKPKTL